MARTLGLQFAAEFALLLGALDDGVDLRLGTTDDGVGRRSVDADLEVRVVDEDVVDVLGGVFDEAISRISSPVSIDSPSPMRRER